MTSNSMTQIGAMMSVGDASSVPGLKSDQLFINMGPQHPSTHGVLRIGLTEEPVDRRPGAADPLVTVGK